MAKKYSSKSTKSTIALLIMLVVVGFKALKFGLKYFTFFTIMFIIGALSIDNFNFITWLEKPTFTKDTESVTYIIIVLAFIVDCIRLVFSIIKHSKHKAFVAEALKEVAVSTDSDDYQLIHDNYERNNTVDATYRKKMLLTMLALFDNKCAKCHDMSNGLDLDHFFLPKMNGGNFALYHNDGYWVNNAIPLCQSCNRSKGARDFKSFFSGDEILHLFTLNQELTKKLNEENVFGET